MTGQTLEERISRGLADQDLTEAVPAVPALASYLRLLQAANERMNLVSRASADDASLVERHLLDSLLAVRFVPREARTLLDIGSGGGFPAIPLLLVRRDLRGTLVESTGKKARFLLETCAALGLTAEIVNARFPGSFPMREPIFDVLTSRAVADAGLLVKSARKALRSGARILLFTTEPLVEGLRRATHGIHRIEFHRAPGAESRGIAVLESST